MNKIQILGSGCCPSCNILFEKTKKIVEELKIEADVEHVKDIQRIIEMGVMQSPVLAIDGVPVLVGGGHGDEEIRKALSGGKGKEPRGCCCGGTC